MLADYWTGEPVTDVTVDVSAVKTGGRPEREVNLPRPVGVTVATFLMLMAATWAWPAIFLIAAEEIPPTWVVLSMGVTTLLGIIAAIAMFMLRKWSVLLYAVTTFIVAALVVAVRPEAWRIGAAVGVAATLRKAAYLGSFYEYSFETALGPVFVVSSDLARPLAAGAQTTLGLGEHGVSVVAQDG